MEQLKEFPEIQFEVVKKFIVSNEKKIEVAIHESQY